MHGRNTLVATLAQRGVTMCVFIYIHGLVAVRCGEVTRPAHSAWAAPWWTAATAAWAGGWGGRQGAGPPTAGWCQKSCRR